MNPLKKLEGMGQSIWLDYIRRGLLDSGELEKLIREDGLSGVTSNPSIFEKAIAGSHDYDRAISQLAEQGREASQIYRTLSLQDVQSAADRLRPVYQEKKGADGFVSLEVSPLLARDAEGTISEGLQLWRALDRPNVLIKVPATREGLEAIRTLTREGVNVNVTLLFSLQRYRQVVDAYVEGLRQRVQAGKTVDHIFSVASFFLSRIDVLVDPLLEKLGKEGEKRGEELQGRIAISSAKTAYRIYKEVFYSEAFSDLRSRGGRPQRLLWASTSTKNPDYSDVKYVEALIGSESVNTLPLETLNAYRDHGDPALRLEENLEEAEGTLHALEGLGIHLDRVTAQLEEEGIEKFATSFRCLMSTLERERAAALKESPPGQKMELSSYRPDVQKVIGRLAGQDFPTRVWNKDASLWKKDSESRRQIVDSLGWLHAPEKLEDALGPLQQFVEEVKEAGLRQVVHMGMGGSSLAPLLFQQTFSGAPDGLPLTVLDTTDPGTIRDIAERIPLQQTLFIVASKSGTTAEPLAFRDTFLARVGKSQGEQVGLHFVSITDPGTPLVRESRQEGFRRVFLNFKDVGGRYSALTYFGIVPAALMGVDVRELLERSLRMVHACASCVEPDRNPGFVLGCALGELARQGRNKVTFLLPQALETFGMWAEQLLAESTGKEGTGIVPIVGEPIAPPEVYGADRVFVLLRLRNEEEVELETSARNLGRAGHPLIEIILEDRLDLGQEFFRWEFATAVAGAVLGINPFDQPNVQESKDNTNRLLREAAREGKLPEREALSVEGPLSLFGSGDAAGFEAILANFMSAAQEGDYLALQAYLPYRAAIDEHLQRLRVALRDSFKLATTVGYGPRFLHSTGQLHKGGPDQGLFIQLTTTDAADFSLPGRSYGFRLFKQAQALGDLESLQRHGRRVVQIDLGPDPVKGLSILEEVLSRLTHQRH